MVFSIIIVNTIGHTDHIGNIGPDIGRYYELNIVSGTSKSDKILPIRIRIGRYLKPCIRLTLCLRYGETYLLLYSLFQLYVRCEFQTGKETCKFDT